MLKHWLQGRPLGHPIHPYLIHFPISLLILAVVLDVAAFIADVDSELLVRGAYYALLGGIATALLAAIFGLADWWDIRRDRRAKRIGIYHMSLNIIAVVLFIVSAAMRYDDLDRSQTPWLPFGLAVLAAAILAVSGYLGGHMVYDDGIAVGRHRRKSETPRETIEIRADDPREFTPVADSARLAEGQTLLVRLGGVAVVVARSGGQLFAFQEFCTHRYGPLSEGAILGDQIECPWHRSCFDLRAGRVAHGPAKVDLKTFRVVEQDSQILLALSSHSRPARENDSGDGPQLGPIDRDAGDREMKRGQA